MKGLLLTSLWFQGLWFLAVLGREPWQWWTLALVLLTCAITLPRQRKPLLWCVGIALLGIALDSVNLLAGLMVFSSPQLPIWLMALWLAFAWYSWWLLPILRGYSKLLIVPVAAVAGAVSYLAGAQLDAVMLPFGNSLTAAVLLCQWGILMALMLWLRGKFA